MTDVTAADTAGVAITGCSGRMGRILTAAVEKHPDIHLAGAVERPGHDWIGRDLGLVSGRPEMGVVVTDDPVIGFSKARAVIDFTAPEATLAFSEISAQARAVHVIGTTGMTDEQIAGLEPASRHAVIVRSGNMSLGMNLLAELTRRVAAALDADFDIEIVEEHHRHKVDAPSGTAIMLGMAAAEGRGVSHADVAKSGRDGITGARARGDIGYAVVRGGGIVGEHRVIFAGGKEIIRLSHSALDRGLFAAGAIKAALWGFDKKPGRYSMLDVLGLASAK